jgi:prepilin-type N-terminal cleavage/methylation domain-containing protein
MDCRTTSRAKHRRAGFTLTELVVSIAIVGICALALVGFAMFGQRGLLAMSNHIELEAQARKSLDQMTKEIRLCKTVTAYSTNSITFTDENNAALTYAFNSSAQTLVRTKAGVQSTLLTGCDSLIFKLYDRDVSNGSFDLIPAATISDCKCVELSWNCSRKFIDSKLNAANTTTAIIVMRLK